MVSEFDQKLLAAMIVFIMLGMGSGLTVRDFLSSLRRPWALMIGFLFQFGFMPLIAFLLAIVLQLPPLLAIGLMVMGCVPGGTTSNIFTYFQKGNLALSMLMTVNSTLFAIVVTPTLLLFYGGFFEAEGITVPIQNISMTLGILLVPVVIGMVIRKVNANVGAVLEFLGGLLGVVVILFLLVTWVPRNREILAITPLPVFAAPIFLGLMGFLVGYSASKILKFNTVDATTISTEIAILNGPLAIAIVLLSFPGDQGQQVVIVPALYSLFIVISASIVTVFFRKLNLASEQKIPSLL